MLTAFPAPRVALAGAILAIFAHAVAMAQSLLSIDALPDGRLRLHWPAGDPPFELEFAEALPPAGAFAPVPGAPSITGTTAEFLLVPTSSPRFFRLRQSAAVPPPAPRPASVVSSSPVDGETGVAVTRETRFRLDQPLAENAVLDGVRLHAEVVGRRLLTRAEIASDRRTLTLFYLEPIPGASRVTVTLDGTGLRDAQGFDLDANGDAIPGGRRVLNFSTLNVHAVGETAVVGHVFASEPNSDGSNRPLAGVTVTVDGQEEQLRATTDATGFFRLQPAPGGRFFVHVDGRTSRASQWPGGAYYPVVGKAWEAVPGRTNNLAGGTGEIFLPRVPAQALQPVSPTTITRVAFAPETLAGRPELAGVELVVPPNALVADDGTRGGRVGIAPVPPDRLPEPLPPGLNLPLVITIQTDGAQNFDRPVPVRFPNLPDPVTGAVVPPGGRTVLWSFNHDTGRWEPQGTATVTPDGRFAVTDPGVGVLQPGWHGVAPGSPAAGRGPNMPPGDGDWDPFNDPEDPCNKEQLQTTFAALDCAGAIGMAVAPAPPVVGCLSGVATGLIGSARDCAIDEAGCNVGIANNFIGAAIGCGELIAPELAPFFKGAGLFHACGLGVGNNYGALVNCERANAGAGPALPPAARHAVGPLTPAEARDNPFLAHAWFTEAFRDFLSALFASPAWFNIEGVDDGRRTPILQALADAVHPGSDGGPAVTEAEAGRARGFPIPAGLTEDDRARLVTRFHRLATGTLTPAERNLPALVAAGAEFEQVLQLYRDLGWGPYDGWRNGLLALTARWQKLCTLGGLAARSSPTSGDESDVDGGDEDNPNAASIAGAATAPAAHWWLLLNEDTGFVQRGRIQPGESFTQLILVPTNFHRLYYLDATGRRFGMAFFRSASAGGTTRLPCPRWTSASQQLGDSDGDGLSDAAEYVVGSSPRAADSDGDGLGDGAEVFAGGDPLDDAPQTLGMVARLETGGEIRDLWTDGQLALLADAEQGVVVVNASDPLNPVLLSRVPLGPVRTVAALGTSAAATTEDDRLVLLDVGLPANPRIVATLDTAQLQGVPEVVIAGNLSFLVGLDSGQVVAVSPGGVVTARVALGDSAVRDLALCEDVVVALSPPRLHTFRESGSQLTRVGSVDSPIGGSASGYRNRIGGGPGLAFSVESTAVVAHRVPQDGAPTPLAGLRGGQFGWRHFQPDGSGSALAAIGPNSFNDGNHHVSLYSLSTPGGPPAFLATLLTQGEAWSVYPAGEHAFVADGRSGLTILRYRAAQPRSGIPDSTPPSLALSAVLPHGDAAESRAPFTLKAVASDDQGVRAVEFFLDGAPVSRDAVWPYRWSGSAPALTSTRTQFTARARATDLAGNATWSAPLTIPILDTTPLSVVRVEPAAGFRSAATPLFRLRAEFDEPLSPATAVPGSLRLAATGPDNVAGTADDIPVSGAFTFLPAENALELRLPGRLNTGKYLGRIAGSVSDANGVALGSDITWTFEVVAPPVTPLWPEPDSVKALDLVTEVRARFGVAMSADTVTPATVQVRGAGPDGMPGTPDDPALTPTAFAFDPETRVVTWRVSVPLGANQYTVYLAPQITGAAGNSLATPVTWRFDVRGPIAWATDQSGAWGVPANWDAGRIPDRDFVIIDRPNASPTTTLTGPGINLNWLRSEESLVVSNTFLTLLEPSRVRGSLQLHQSTLRNDQRFDVAGPFIWTGQSRLDGGGILAASGDVLLTGAGDRVLGHQFLQAGRTLRLEQGSLVFAHSNAVLHIQPGARFDIATGPIPSALRAAEFTLYGRPLLRNEGTVVFDPSTTQADFQMFAVRLQNEGRVEVRSGSLRLTTAATVNSGVYHVATGASLTLAPHLTAAAGSITGEGSVIFDNGLLEDFLGRFDSMVLGRYAVAGETRVTSPVTFAGGVQSGPGAFRLTTPQAAAIFAAGSAAFSGPVQTEGGGLLEFRVPAALPSLNLSGGRLVASNVTVTVQSPAQVSSGAVIRGPGVLRLQQGGAVGDVVMGANSILEVGDGTVFEVGGDTRLNGDVTVTHPSTFRILSGGQVLAAQTGTRPGRFLGAGTVENLGTLRADPQNVPRAIENLFNHGALELLSGQLTLRNPTTNTGAYLVREGATLQFQTISRRDPTLLTPTASVAGAGTVVLQSNSSDEWISEGTLDIGTLIVTNRPAHLLGFSRITNLVQSGSIRGADDTHILGSWTWLGGSLDGGRIRNHGVGQTRGAFIATLSEDTVLENAGTLRFFNKTGSSGFTPNAVLRLGGIVRNLPGGLLLIDTNGIVVRASNNTQGAIENEGTLRTSLPLTVRVPIRNSGLLEIGGDGITSLTLESPFEQSAPGTLALQVGGAVAGTSFDRLALGTNGRLQLAGTLRIRFTDGFNPAVGDRFLVIQGAWTEARGRFQTLDLPAAVPGRQWQVNYLPGGVEFAVIAGP